MNTSYALRRDEEGRSPRQRRIRDAPFFLGSVEYCSWRGSTQSLLRALTKRIYEEITEAFRSNMEFGREAFECFVFKEKRNGNSFSFLSLCMNIERVVCETAY
ncbi:hypothetical protein TNIN_242451 [Trichonephila inaurata madagascariensis]|uniref:Uncharacterized protein n=1 Tax=Trichonephila inaurata madagascariensis TaxID=2747483 RepID=A0A8X7CGG9_9ARAC|nr:hypothetical protein TNIN_242451 [Trichonephila inaurata madagascariensis]